MPTGYFTRLCVDGDLDLLRRAALRYREGERPADNLRVTDPSYRVAMAEIADLLEAAYEFRTQHTHMADVVGEWRRLVLSGLHPRTAAEVLILIHGRVTPGNSASTERVTEADSDKNRQSGTGAACP